ncbi:hypothetical protein EIP91_004032 [Steccherinum ochraceum]|uniref:Uncharacterized protein n=1 Tax=Steccherinum ochraceum TaxID=92696 RepID=A0A4R0RQ31_9APHY|nr:hypothetical protein EIP91_004032 [Steccherinum ochraceum]
MSDLSLTLMQQDLAGSVPPTPTPLGTSGRSQLVVFGSVGMQGSGLNLYGTGVSNSGSSPSPASALATSTMNALTNDQDWYIQRTALSHATHALLVQSGNSAYASLQAEMSGLKVANERLLFDINTAQVELKTTKALFDTLAHCVAIAEQHRNGQIPPVIAGLLGVMGRQDEQDYRLLTPVECSGVRFYTQNSWKQWKAENVNTGVGSVTADSTTTHRTGENVMMRFMETLDGATVSGARASEMRRQCRGYFQLLLDLGIAPARWSQASSQAIGLVFRELRKAFPEFRACENDWKARLFVTIIYPDWRKNHLPPAVTSGPHTSHSPSVSNAVNTLMDVNMPGLADHIPEQLVEAPEPDVATDDLDIGSEATASTTLATPTELTQAAVIRPAAIEVTSEPAGLAGGPTAFVVGDSDLELEMTGPQTAAAANSEVAGSEPAAVLTTDNRDATSVMATIPSEDDEWEIVARSGSGDDHHEETSSELVGPTVSPAPAPVRRIVNPLAGLCVSDIAPAPTTTARPPPPKPTESEESESGPATVPGVPSAAPPTTRQAKRKASDSAEKSTSGKKIKLAVPTESTGPQNLCMKEWLKTNQGGTLEAFKMYYQSLTGDEVKYWKLTSKIAKN